MNQFTEKFNRKIIGQFKSNVTNKQIWNIISKPSSLELFHPFCKKNTVLKWSQSDALDEIEYYSGLVYTRNFINWIDGVGYDLLIGEKDSNKSFVSWRIQNTNNAILTVSIYPYKYNTGSKFIKIFPYLILVQPLLQKYINSVMLGLEYYIKNNKKVKKNQFGSIRFFSN